MIECPMCDGPPVLLGVMGNLTWFRCRNCGWQFARNTSEVEVPSEYDAELKAAE